MPIVPSPVLTMVDAYSRLIMALLLPSRTTGDLLAGMWPLLSVSLGAVPKMLVWDNEAGIDQHHKLTVGARSFAGTLGTRVYQTAPRDPEAKGVVERANGYLQTSFLPRPNLLGVSRGSERKLAVAGRWTGYLGGHRGWLRPPGHSAAGAFTPR